MSNRRHPQASVDAAVAAYGKKSAAQLAADLGCSVGAITHWWAEAKAAGRIDAAFGRFDGASKKLQVVAGRVLGAPAAQPVVVPVVTHPAGNDRPHCRTPDACIARTKRHCRGCASFLTMQERLSDPVKAQINRQHIVDMNRDPAIRARQIATGRKNSSFVDKLRRTGRAKLKAAKADPEVEARRKAGAIAAIPQMLATRARNHAADLGIPEWMVPEYRDVRRKHRVNRAEALDMLRQFHPVVFSQRDAERRAAALRELGPVPAIGTPGRAAWTRNAAAALASLSLDDGSASRARVGEG